MFKFFWKRFKTKKLSYSSLQGPHNEVLHISFHKPTQTQTIFTLHPVQVFYITSAHSFFYQYLLKIFYVGYMLDCEYQKKTEYKEKILSSGSSVFWAIQLSYFSKEQICCNRIRTRHHRSSAEDSHRLNWVSPSLNHLCVLCLYICTFCIITLHLTCFLIIHYYQSQKWSLIHLQLLKI